MSTIELATTSKGPLTPDELAKLDAYWRAANYLSVGQIYLYDNPLQDHQCDEHNRHGGKQGPPLALVSDHFAEGDAERCGYENERQHFKKIGERCRVFEGMG